MAANGERWYPDCASEISGRLLGSASPHAAVVENMLLERLVEIVKNHDDRDQD